MSTPPLLLSLRDAAETLAISYKTARNWLNQGRFPVPTHLIGGKRVVKVADLQAFVAGLGIDCANDPSNESPESAPTPKRGRGRPRLGARH